MIWVNAVGPQTHTKYVLGMSVVTSGSKDCSSCSDTRPFLPDHFALASDNMCSTLNLYTCISSEDILTNISLISIIHAYDNMCDITK